MAATTTTKNSNNTTHTYSPPQSHENNTQNNKTRHATHIKTQLTHREPEPKRDTQNTPLKNESSIETELGETQSRLLCTRSASQDPRFLLELGVADSLKSTATPRRFSVACSSSSKVRKRVSVGRMTQAISGATSSSQIFVLFFSSSSKINNTQIPSQTSSKREISVFKIKARKRTKRG